MSDWRDGYDDWKLRSPDWDDDPCAHVRAECDEEMRDLHDEIVTLKGLLKTVLIETFPDHVTFEQWRMEAREALGLPDPNAPKGLEDDIAF